ncbi:MAG: VOC family protein [Phycisphaerales bacterium]
MTEIEATVAVNRLVPYVHVADVDASLAFYALLGFTVVSAMKDDAGKTFWVMARSDAAEIMLAQASGPIEAEQQAVLFYMYSQDLQSLRQSLLAGGIRDAGPYSGAARAGDTTRMVHTIARPSHMPGGEMRLIDPDGYVVLVGQLD